MKNKDLSLDSKIMEFFQRVLDYSKIYNEQDLLKHCQSWQSTINLTHDNIHPFTLEDIKLYKTRTRMGIYYRVLNEVNQYLLDKEAELKNILTKASELTSQMLLASFQLGLLSKADIMPAYTPSEITAIWNKIKTSDQIRIFQYNILLLIGDQDALAILESGMKMLNERA